MTFFLFPGENAKMNRDKMAQIIHRYFAGDKSLLDEIEANAMSKSAVAQMARASLPVINEEETIENRKRKRELEEAEIQQMKTNTENTRIANITAFTNLMSVLDPNWKEDTRLVLQTQDLLKNTMFSSVGQKRITNGENMEDHRPITLTQVAQDMGHRLTRGQQIKAGRILAERYREKYNKEPSKHSQFVDGATRLVNSYMEQDRDLVEEVIEECLC